ncbi:MAG: hypothetical protein ABIK15_07310 [Pseudomonadota bacterium]
MDKPEAIENEKDKPAGAEYVEISHKFFDRFEKKEVDCAFRFRRPTAQMASRAQKRMMKTPIPALQDLCMDAIHEDDRKRFLDTGKTYPGLYSTFGGALLNSIGFGDLGNE